MALKSLAAGRRIRAELRQSIRIMRVEVQAVGEAVGAKCGDADVRWR